MCYKQCGHLYWGERLGNFVLLHFQTVSLISASALVLSYFKYGHNYGLVPTIQQISSFECFSRAHQSFLRHDYIRKKRTDSQTTPASTEAHAGLQLYRPQARRQVRDQQGCLPSSRTDWVPRLAFGSIGLWLGSNRKETTCTLDKENRQIGFHLSRSRGSCLNMASEGKIVLTGRRLDWDSRRPTEDDGATGYGNPILKWPSTYSDKS